jgi:hypothetical protein
MKPAASWSAEAYAAGQPMTVASTDFIRAIQADALEAAAKECETLAQLNSDRAVRYSFAPFQHRAEASHDCATAIRALGGKA